MEDKKNWYDIDWKEEREEIANLEYSDPLSNIEEEIEMIEEPVCTCDLEIDLPCELHSKLNEENED